jgi:hypothetical protein
LQNFIAKVAKRRKTRRLLGKGGQGGHFHEKGGKRGKRGAFTCQLTTFCNVAMSENFVATNISFIIYLRPLIYSARGRARVNKKKRKGK